jgi:hypothetical protein
METHFFRNCYDDMPTHVSTRKPIQKRLIGIQTITDSKGKNKTIKHFKTV